MKIKALFAMGLVFVACTTTKVDGDTSAKDASADGEAAGCTENPWECPTGQTCWFTQAGTFECLNALAGTKDGDECQPYADSPTCSDGQICLQLDNSNSASCASYCDPKVLAHACPAGAVCQQINFKISTTTTPAHVCISTGAKDAGSDAADGGGNDAETDAGDQDSGDAAAE